MCLNSTLRSKINLLCPISFDEKGLLYTGRATFSEHEVLCALILLSGRASGLGPLRPPFCKVQLPCEGWKTMRVPAKAEQGTKWCQISLFEPSWNPHWTFWYVHQDIRPFPTLRGSRCYPSLQQARKLQPTSHKTMVGWVQCKENIYNFHIGGLLQLGVQLYV